MAKQKYYNGTTWEVIGTDANKTSIVDAANYFTSTDVEGALQELGETLNSLGGILTDSASGILDS